MDKYIYIKIDVELIIKILSHIHTKFYLLWFWFHRSNLQENNFSTESLFIPESDETSIY